MDGLVVDEHVSAKARYQGLAVSREEYLDLAEDGFKYDMIEGRLFMSPSAIFEHGEIQGILISLFRLYLRDKKVGKVTIETDILLSDGGDVLRPDISFILNENLSMVKKHIHGAPDIVCEVLSESTRERDLGEKADRYLTNGVQEYWIVDLENKSLELRINKKTSWQILQADSLESKLLSGFKVTKSDLFGE